MMHANFQKQNKELILRKHNTASKVGHSMLTFVRICQDKNHN